MLEKGRMKIDLGVMNSDSAVIESFYQMGRNLSLSGFATSSICDKPVKTLEQIEVYRRVNIKNKNIGSIKKQIEQSRRSSVILALEMGPIDRTNWAIEDKRVDLLTINPSGEHALRATTARLASGAEVALEIQIAPLLQTSGLNRSKILKVYREAIETANDNDMMIVLTSGARTPIELRAPVAMTHIGRLLGLERSCAEEAIDEVPSTIISRNLKKLDPDYVTAGVEVIKENKRG